jgi:hypothetical protein
MSKMRPECQTYRGPRAALPDETALFLIRDAVAQRRTLIYGRLHDGEGGHCAVGAFWAKTPDAVLNMNLIDEVAAVNDSIPPTASPKERWRKVMSWLRWKIRVLANPAIKRP